MWCGLTVCGVDGHTIVPRDVASPGIAAKETIAGIKPGHTVNKFSRRRRDTLRNGSVGTSLRKQRTELLLIVATEPANSFKRGVRMSEDSTAWINNALKACHGLTDPEKQIKAVIDSAKYLIRGYYQDVSLQDLICDLESALLPFKDKI